MAEALEVLQILQVFVFGGLGGIALYQWSKRKGAAEAWAAATFGSLALVVLLSRVLPDEHTGLGDLIRQVNVVVVVLFPYLLFRFTATFRRVPLTLELLAGLLTAAAVIGALIVGPPPLAGEERSSAFQIYVYVVLVQWVTLSAIVALRLWRDARSEPGIARRRMRTLAVAALGLALAIVLAGAARESDDASQIWVQLLAMASAGLFLLGLFPPRFVRAGWRRDEEEALRGAHLELMEAMDAEEVISALLPHVSRILGGKGALITRADGSVWGMDGLTEEEAVRIAGALHSDEGSDAHRIIEGSAPVLSVPLAGGWLGVQGTPFMPFFGREETEMMQRLALLAALALNRAELFTRERHMHMQLVHAQEVARIGSWDWDMATGEVVWSEELFSIFGVDPAGFDGDYEAALAHVHPDDRPLLEAEIAKAVETRGHFSVEHRVVRPDGHLLMMHAEGKVLTDQKGDPVRMIGVGQDITERKRQERYREQFIANAAHELRTPLTSLLGFVEILANRRDRMKQDDLEEAYKVMQRAGNRLGALVNNLLDLTKVQQGHVHLDLVEVPLRPAINDVVQANPPPSGKDVEVRVPDGLKVVADPGRLGQIVLNLVSNAYKYGGSSITVSAAMENGEVRVEVADDGPGVEPRLLDSLFEPFRRGESVTTITGSGLGLAISKMLIEASGGRIWYESGDPKGARFNVALKRP